ncbi:MAG: MarR family transcriptional regulator [Acidobacteria bacterium]|nr:MarR family transcriptional regulator [Acidobacteriota bacterium]
MAGALRDEIRQRTPFRSPEEEAYLNLQRTAAHLLQAHAAFLRSYRLTPTQYNVLRILRGSHPDALACREVGERMVTPVPDVTRLLDRLEAQALVERQRDLGDRRIVQVGITEAGLEALAAVDGPLAKWLSERLGGLGADELRQLSRSLEVLRRDEG